METAAERDDRCAGLQWVHGRITVVIGEEHMQQLGEQVLQWVHGRITVVMQIQTGPFFFANSASMGPRSDNRGYIRTLTVGSQ